MTTSSQPLDKKIKGISLGYKKEGGAKAPAVRRYETIFQRKFTLVRFVFNAVDGFGYMTTTKPRKMTLRPMQSRQCAAAHWMGN
jgi:hypothetical protein